MSLPRSAMRAQIPALLVLLLFSLNVSAINPVNPPPTNYPVFVIGWNPVTATNLAGYVLYYGTNSGSYASHLDVGTNTTITLTNLQPGQVYYLTVTGYDNSHMEGTAPPPISILIPGLVRIQTAASSNMVLSFPVYPSHWYEIQASTNLKSWTTIASTAVAASNVWMSLSDTNAGAYKLRYYRSIGH